MKSAKEFWKDKFDEYPQNDAEKLAVVMMAEYSMDAYYAMLSVLKTIDDCHDVYAPDLGMSNIIFEDVLKAIELAEIRLVV